MFLAFLIPIPFFFPDIYCTVLIYYNLSPSTQALHAPDIYWFLSFGPEMKKAVHNRYFLVFLFLSYVL